MKPLLVPATEPCRQQTVLSAICFRRCVSSGLGHYAGTAFDYLVRRAPICLRI